MSLFDQTDSIFRIAGEKSVCTGDVEPSLQKEVQVEQFASRFILWGLEVLYWAVIDDSVALFQIRSNEDKLP